MAMNSTPLVGTRLAGIKNVTVRYLCDCKKVKAEQVTTFSKPHARIFLENVFS
jgi:hypothetical protein